MHGRGLPEESRKAEAVDDEVMTIAATAATSRIVAKLVPDGAASTGAPHLRVLSVATHRTSGCAYKPNRNF